jgi:hypothetical protein
MKTQPLPRSTLSLCQALALYSAGVPFWCRAVSAPALRTKMHLATPTAHPLHLLTVLMANRDFDLLSRFPCLPGFPFSNRVSSHSDQATKSILTEIDGVDRRYIKSHSLHDEGSHRVADIAICHLYMVLLAGIRPSNRNPTSSKMQSTNRNAPE